MVVKLYISGISGNKEVKKKQQRVQMILDSKQITYEAIDITEPGKEKDKEFMQQYGKVRESLGRYPLPPQIFNDDNFCGDYEDFDLANEVDELEKFLHIETKDLENGSKINGLREEVIDTKKTDDEHVNDQENHKVNGIDESDNADETPSSEFVIDGKEEAPEDGNPAQTNEFEETHVGEEVYEETDAKLKESEKMQNPEQAEEETAAKDGEMEKDVPDDEKEQDE